MNSLFIVTTMVIVIINLVPLRNIPPSEWTFEQRFLFLHVLGINILGVLLLYLLVYFFTTVSISA